MEKILNWLADWFGENAGVVRDEFEGEIEKNYIESGLLDSFQFLGLIADIETYFGIFFSEEDLSDIEILSIQGIANKIFLLKSE